jgi:hypothetical protein
LTPCPRPSYPLSSASPPSLPVWADFYHQDQERDPSESLMSTE